MTWNASDRDIINRAYDVCLPVVYVPLYGQTAPWQPDTAEVRFQTYGRRPVVRRFTRCIGDKGE